MNYYNDINAGLYIVNPITGKRFDNGKIYGNYNIYNGSYKQNDSHYWHCFNSNGATINPIVGIICEYGKCGLGLSSVAAPMTFYSATQFKDPWATWTTPNNECLNSVKGWL